MENGTKKQITKDLYEIKNSAEKLLKKVLITNSIMTKTFANNKK